MVVLSKQEGSSSLMESAEDGGYVVRRLVYTAASVSEVRITECHVTAKESVEK